MEINRKELLFKAKDALKNSYAPYSNFHVGAAILTDDGKVFYGSNIENSSYSLTICAERVAIYNAYSSGVKKNGIIAIAIVNDRNETCYPCGACLNVINELCNENIEIILDGKNDPLAFKLKDLLTHPFNL